MSEKNRQRQKTATSPRRQRGRPKAGDHVISNDELLDEALTYFSEVGYEGASMRALARRLDVSNGLVTARFGSKAQLWCAAVDRGMGKLVNIVEVTLDENTLAHKKLRSVMISIMMTLWATPAILQLINYEGSRDTERLKYLLDSYALQRIASRFDKLVNDGIREGIFRSVSPRLVFMMFAHGVGAVLCLKPMSKHRGLLTSNSVEEAQALAEDAADMIIRSLIL